MRYTFVTQEEARSWFSERAKEIVGVAGNTFSCPLAKCARYQTGLEDGVSVSVDGITIGVMRQSEPWIENFVRAVDKLGAGTQIAGVTAASLL